MSPMAIFAQLSRRIDFCALCHKSYYSIRIFVAFLYNRLHENNLQHSYAIDYQKPFQYAIDYQKPFQYAHVISCFLTSTGTVLCTRPFASRQTHCECGNTTLLLVICINYRSSLNKLDFMNICFTIAKILPIIFTLFRIC